MKIDGTMPERIELLITTPEGRDLLVEIDGDGVYVETRVEPGEGSGGVNRDHADLKSAGGDYALAHWGRA